VLGNKTETPSVDAQERRTLRLILYDAIASEAMGTLTTGVFLAGFAVALGADNASIGILAAVPFFVQLLQIPATLLVERLRTRRDICVWSAGIGRVFLIGAAAAPLLPSSMAMVVLIVSLAIYQGTIATTAVAIVLALIGGALIDGWKDRMPDDAALGYSLLFGLSALIGFVGVYLLRITPDRPMAPAEKSVPALALLTAPLRDVNFRRLLFFMASWNFTMNLAAPFFAIYMLKTLNYSMTSILGLTIASQISNLAALQMWGSLIDRFSNKAVLGIAAPLFLLCLLGWSLTGITWMQPMLFYFLVGLHILMGVATAGVGLASGNIAMKLSPAGQATAYLATNSVITASCTSVAPILGGLFADFFAARKLTLALTWEGGLHDVTLQVLNFQSWTFFFGIACLAGLYSLHRLYLVEEPAGTTDRLLLRHLFMEARRSVHSLSSAAGLLRVSRLMPQWLVRA
jgi:MFS family permease